MKLAILLLLTSFVVSYGFPVEKIETVSWEEQHQKTIKSAPVEQPKVEEEGHQEEHHKEVHHDNQGVSPGIHTGSSEVVIEVKPGSEIHAQPGTGAQSEHHVESERHENVETHHSVPNAAILEAAPFPAHSPNIPHVNETEARINIHDLEQQFSSAQTEGGEGLDRFLAMINTERETLQKMYEQMSLQTEANVRGSLQKSREWEENARRHAKESLERLLELQKRAEEKTRDLVSRQKATVKCVNCEDAKLREQQQQQSGGAANVDRHESRSYHHQEGGAPAEVVSGSHHGSDVHHTSSANLGANLDSSAQLHHYNQQQFPVETTTTVEEWSTKFAEHSSTVVDQ